MFKSVIRTNGKATGMLREDGVPVALDGNAFNRDTAQAMQWLETDNAKQPIPLDLSDKEPEPPEPDPVKDAIMALLDKDQNGVLSPAERLDFCFKVCKRLVRNI